MTTVEELCADNRKLVDENLKLRKENKELRDNYEQYKAVAEPEIAALKTAILKLRNCMNCKHRDVGGYTTCEVIGVVLCNHWEMKE